MINEARPYASLSSGLLARKGAAKPAMRPQGYTGFEDLGWNDMGHAQPEEPVEHHHEHVPSSIAALTPLPRHGDNPVAVQQRAIAETFDDGVEEAVSAPVIERTPAEVVKLPKRQKRHGYREAGYPYKFVPEII